MPIPKVFGHPAPFAPTLIDGDKIARKITKTTDNGKGSTSKTKSEGFIATRAFLCCEGEIAAFARIYRNGKLVYSTIAGDNIDADSIAFASQLRLYYGTDDQGPDPSLEAIHGVGNTPCYPRRAYFVVVDDDETDTRGAANQYRVEMIENGVIEDCADSDGPAYYWPLAGSGVELIQGKDAELAGDAGLGPALVAGSAGSLYLPTKDSYAFADYGTEFGVSGSQGFTISCWCQPLDTDGGSVFKNVMTYWESAAIGIGPYFLCLDGTDNMQPRGQLDGGGGGGVIIQADAPASTGKPTFLLLTFKPTDEIYGDLKFYVNAELIGTEHISQSVAGGSALHPLAFGGWGAPDSTGFIGYISEAKIYRRPMEYEEVLANYLPAGVWFPSPDGSGIYVDRYGNTRTRCFSHVTVVPPTWKEIATEICRRCGVQ